MERDGTTDDRQRDRQPPLRTRGAHLGLGRRITLSGRVDRPGRRPQTVPISLASTRGEVTGTLSPTLPPSRTTAGGSAPGEFIGLGTCVPYDRVNHTFAFTGLAAVPAPATISSWCRGHEILARSPRHRDSDGRHHKPPDAEHGTLRRTVRGVVTARTAPFAGTVGAHQGLLSPRPRDHQDGRPLRGQGPNRLRRTDRHRSAYPEREVADRFGSISRAAPRPFTTSTSAIWSGIVHGTVTDMAGWTLAGVNIWLCHVAAAARSRRALTGYVADRVAVGPITAAPYLENYVGQTNTATATTDGEAVTLDLTCGAPLGAARKCRPVGGDGVRRYAGPRPIEPTRLRTTTGCARGTATYAIDFASTTGVEFTGALTRDPVGSGTYSAPCPPPVVCRSSDHHRDRHLPGRQHHDHPLRCRISTRPAPFSTPTGSRSGRQGRSATFGFGRRALHRRAGWLRHHEPSQPRQPVDHRPRRRPSGTSSPATTDSGLSNGLPRPRLRWRRPDDRGLADPTGGRRPRARPRARQRHARRPHRHVTATPAKAAVGTPVTLRAAITGAAGRPTGTVDFTLDGDPVTMLPGHRRRRWHRHPAPQRQGTLGARGGCGHTAGMRRIPRCHRKSGPHHRQGASSVRFSPLGVVTRA